MRSYTRKVMTVGDLRGIANSSLPDDALIWIETTEHRLELVDKFVVERVMTPDEGFPEELGVCLRVEKIG